jgi:hypothetical protein
MGMPPKASVRSLTDHAQAALPRIAKASSERADRVRRATALLVIAGGQSFARAAHQAGFRSGTAVAALVRRFNRVGMAARDLTAGRGRRPPSGAAARAQIVATAPRPPDRTARQMARRPGR